MPQSIISEHKKNYSSKGFTLIELLVVLGIIGVLAVVLFMGINPLAQLQKSNDTNRKADLATMQRAMELYYQDNGRYPTSSGDFKITNGTTTLNWGNPWTPYMSKLPADPVATKKYVYYSPPSSSGQTYYLYASIERGSEDKNVCNAGNACVSLTTGGAGFPSANACGSVCNFGVSSPNVAP